MVDRVIATQSAIELISRLQSEYGELMFYQSGGCCDNSSANCYLPTDMTLSPNDIKLGDVGDVPFYISASQYEYWKHTQLILDVINGHSGTFSLEGNTGKAFHIRSRVFTDAEWAELQAAGLV